MSAAERTIASARVHLQRASAMREYATAPTTQSREVKADRAGLWSMLVHLWPYIWPADRRDLKERVVLATVLIFAAKLATLNDPYLFYEVIEGGHGAGANIQEGAFTRALVMTYFTRRLMN